jgi:predicted acylesterase/phospholipase RssA
MIENLVMGGGGARGLVYIPCIKVMEQYGLLNIKMILGTSIGSIIGTLYCIGYSGLELEKIFSNFNPGKFNEIKIENFFNYFKNLGLNDGKEPIKIIKILFKHQNIKETITFKELYELTKIKLVLTGTNITKSKLEYFNYKTTPDMEVILAIRISTCIPLYVIPIRYNNNLYIDGGLLTNIPIQYVKKKDYKKTLVLLNYRKNEYLDIDKSIINYLITVYDMIRRVNINDPELFILKMNPALSGGDFDTTDEKRKECFEYGTKETLKYIAENMLEYL